MYDRLNSSVFWESLDVPLDLIDRIEVIRGAGGATWGANAVNGVINIVTKPSGDTPGAAVTVTGGTTQSLQASARYGGSLGDLSYRVNSQWSGHGQSVLDADTPANDRWESQTHGIRLDWSQNAETVMVEAGTTLASLRGSASAFGSGARGETPVRRGLARTNTTCSAVDPPAPAPLHAGGAVIRQHSRERGHRESAALLAESRCSIRPGSAARHRGREWLPLSRHRPTVGGLLDCPTGPRTTS